MKKVGQFFQCIAPFLCALCIQIVVSFLALTIVIFNRSMKLADEGPIDPNAIANGLEEVLSSEVVLAISILTAVICMLVFGLWYRHSSRKYGSEGRKVKFTLKSILYMVLLAVGLQFGLSMLLNAVAMIKPDWFDTYGDIMEQLGMGNSILSLVYIALIAPISEELIFRGVILGYGKRFLPMAAANLLQALLFGIYHMNLVQGIYAFVLGMILGAVRISFNTLYASVLLHMFINVSGIFLNLVLTEEMLQIPFAMIAIAVLSLGAVIVSLRYLAGKADKDTVEEDF